jgi:hypothetical protein
MPETAVCGSSERHISLNCYALPVAIVLIRTVGLYGLQCLIWSSFGLPLESKMELSRTNAIGVLRDILAI